MPNPRRGLKKKTYKGLKKYEARVLNFNPQRVYDRIKIDPYKRVQSITSAEAFPPNEKKLCSCGCGVKLKGRQRRWASEECQWFAYHVISIINGHSEIISKYLKLYHGYWGCSKCGVTDVYVEYKNGMCVDAIHKDHVVAVQNGGGGCWLSNFQLLCIDCHNEKTKRDNRAAKNSKKETKVRKTLKKKK